MSKVFRLSGTKIEANIGTFARQADGSVWLKCGDTVLLSTAVASKKQSEFMGFFPLTVEFRERPPSVGKFPGGFIKREGRLSDSEILLSRLVDRSVRPLFPKFLFNEVQLMSTLMSYDAEFPQEVLGILGTSLSLAISGIPFNGPIGSAIFCKNGSGDWELNPTYSFAEEADNKVLIVGTERGICMVEATCNFVSDDEILSLMERAMPEISKQVQWQNEIKKELGVEDKISLESEKFNNFLKEVESAFPSDWKERIFAKDKETLNTQVSELKDEVLAKFASKIESGDISEAELKLVYETKFKELVPQVITEKNQRFDFRKTDEIRQITSSVDILPKTHGSAVFTRGQTQALSSITLGTSSDAQKVEMLVGGLFEKTFMLHYNFPPYSTGEVKPLRGVGRREIGHGYLAEKSFKDILPAATKFPYTIRSVVDLLESNGSSSMATVCATTLGLMDAGVPLERMISGIAMGLVGDGHGHFAILSDITGTEDAFGIMDLKVVGDDKGICAIQMDIKSDKGIPKEVISQALEQARKGRSHILDEMKKCLDAPRKELKDSAPQMKTIKVPTGKISAIIGSGGKTIKEITSVTGAQIDIADDGNVTIFSSNKTSSREAERWIKLLTGDVQVGSSYHGKVSSVVDFGVFVSLVPGKDGLVHISTIDKAKQKNLRDTLKQGDEIDVVVVSHDSLTGRTGLVAPSLESSETFE